MKTNAMLSSPDREIFGITIRQSTDKSFLSITDLQKAYEIARWQYGWSEKKINDILSYTDTKERMYYLLKERDVIKTSLSEFTEMLNKEGITNTLKGLGVYKTTGRGANKTTMADPYIWVLLAMELNPMLYAKVIMWITDSLIFSRIEAGSEYKPMNTAIKSIIPNPDYPKYAIAINKNVFGIHKVGMRNIASAKELKKIHDIEMYIKNAIEAGFIKNDTDILKAIEIYH